MQLGTFTANIIVDGKALEEYDVVSESPTKATCWVASEEGKPFSVQWKCHEGSRVAGTQGSVYVDGISCGNKKNFPGVLGVDDACTFTRHFDTTVTRDLMFARVQLSDDDSLLNKEIPKNLGEISLVIKRGDVIKRSRCAGSQNCAMLGNNEKLHERSKKATVHCVGFGPEKPRKLTSHRLCLIRNGQPRITFVFKYRPLSVLQANGIAPRPTSTDAGPSPENSSAEDIKPAQLNDRIQDLENELKRLRDLQTNNPEDRKSKRIKTEEPRERRRPPFAPGEIIDLT